MKKLFLFTIIPILLVGCNKASVKPDIKNSEIQKPLTVLESNDLGVSEGKASVEPDSKTSESQQPTVVTGSTYNSPQYGVSVDSAAKVISNILGKLPDNYHLVFDDEDKRDGKDYYVFHGYEEVKDDSKTGDSHTVTFGRYYVDKITGKPYEMDLVEEELIVLKPKPVQGQSAVTSPNNRLNGRP